MITIIEPTYEILTQLNGFAEHIEQCGRTCYRSEDHITSGSAGKFIKRIIRSGHESVIEHASVSVRVICSRACSHQIVRSRLCSFSQESQRYVRVIKSDLRIQTESDVIDAYKEGLTYKRISQISEFSSSTVGDILRRHNIKARAHNKGLIHHDFFASIDAPEKAYLLGMILADGCLHKTPTWSQISLCQHKDIIWYLTKMYQVFIKPSIQSCQAEGNCRALNIRSQQICKDLEEKGIIQNKQDLMTLEDSERLWASIPQKFKGDFLRGFMDGDGCVYHQFSKQKKPRLILEWSGHKHFLEVINNWLQENFGFAGCIYKKQGCKHTHLLRVAAQKTVKLISHMMYTNFIYPFGHPIKASRILSHFDINSLVYSEKDGMQIILPPSHYQKTSLWRYYQTLEKAAQTYINLLKDGVRPEDARYILPNATKTELIITANLRQWRLMFQQRALNPHAQWEIRNIFKGILDEFSRALPSIFCDLGENS
jgi:thymidylate synthase ThyX